MGWAPATIDWEIARKNNADDTYGPETAGRRYLARRRHGLLLDRLPELVAFVVERLYENWTPEQIAGWLKSGAERLRVLSDKANDAWIYGRSQR